MSRKQKTQRKKERRARETVTRFEAAAGSKKSLVEQLAKSGTVKSKADARRVLDAAEKGQKLPDKVRTYLDRNAPKASKEEARTFEKEVLRPRQERAKVTNERKRIAPMEKALRENLAGDERGKWIKQSLDARGRKATRVFDDGVLQMGGKSWGPYVRVVGITRNYHQRAAPQMVEYMLITEEMRERAIGVGESEFFQADRYEGLTKHSGWAQKEQAIRDAFEELTEGNGELLAFWFTDNKRETKDE